MKKIDHYNILLAEDEYLLRQSLKRTIEALDEIYQVKAEASNGEEALEVLRKEPIHFVITDIQMPVMNGLELARNIRNQYPDIPVIILTGFSDFTYAQEAIRQQVFDYLLKPVTEEALISVFSKLQLTLDRIYELPGENALNSQDARCRVAYIVSYIQDHYMDEIDLGKLADQFGFSSAYLSKIFKRYTGSTPLKLLTEVRIHQAKRLLAESSLSIQEVGEKVGYPDQFYFSKTFRKIVGVNPSGYRKDSGDGG